MVELNDELVARIQVFKDHLLEPRTNSVFMALPADPGALQGWDPSLAIVGELHVVTDDTFEALAARAGKRDRSLPLDDEQAWSIANPALDGAEVVISPDGSFSRDCTALVVATVEDRPHVALYQLWEAPEGARDWRVPVVAVEDAIRAACVRWRVLEVAADPYRWQRRLEVLDGDGIPVHEFFQTAARMGPATARMYQLVVDQELTHDGDSRWPARSPTPSCAKTPAAPG